MSTPAYAIPGGMNTPLAQAEWNTFLDRRRQLIEDGAKILSMTDTVRRVSGADPTSAFGAVLQQYQSGAMGPTATGIGAQQRTDSDTNRLLGAARFYKIPDAERMNVEQLREVVEQRRATRRRDGTDPMTGLVGAFGSGFANGIVNSFAEEGTPSSGPAYALQEFGPSVVGGFLAAIQQVPFIGDGLRKIKMVQRAEQNVALLEEAARGNEVRGDSNFGRGAARFVGQSFLYVAAGELVGASGFAAGVANPIVRGSLQGGAAAVLTETGGDDPVQDRLTRVAIGAGFGGVATWGIEKVIAKLGRSFPRPSQAVPDPAPNYATTDNLPSPYVRAVPEEDIPLAEWEFVQGTGFDWTPSGTAPQSAGRPPLQVRGLLPGPATQQVSALDTYIARFGTRPGNAPPGRESLLELDSPAPWPGPNDAMAGGRGVPSVDMIEARLTAFPEDIGARAWYVWELSNQLSFARRAGGAAGEQVALAERVLEELTGTARTPAVVPIGAAGQEAAALTKQATLLESPVLPAVGRQVAYTDADVAVAAINRAPGQISVIRNIDNPGAVSSALVRHIAAGTGPADFRVVLRTGTDDLLVSDGAPIPDKVVEQYARLGFFEGQEATVPGGSLGRVRQAGAEWSMIEDQSGMVYWARNADIVPGRASVVSEVPAQAYADMRAYAMVRMNDEAIAAGLEPIDWFSDELATQLPRYIDEFLEQGAVQGEALRGAYKALFTQERVRDFRMLAPEEFALADEIAEQATRDSTLAAIREARPVWLEEVAETKGLQWVQEPGGMGGRLVSRNTGEEFALADREEGFAFLANYEVDLPDYSPLGTVPAELASSPASPGASAGPKHTLTEDEVSSVAMRSLDRMEAELAGGGGGEPPAGFGGSFGTAPDGPPLLPPADETIGKQLERARLHDRATYDKVLQRFDNLAMRVLDPMRNFSLGIEDALVSAGFDRGIYWQHYSAVSNGRAVAHNEAAPWHTALNGALGKIRRKFIRDGTVTLIGEMNENVALDAMQKAGYTAREIEGQLEIRRLLEGLRQEYEVRQLLDYMPHLRSRAAAGDGLGDLDQIFAGGGRFFAELVREGSIDVREMNAAILLHRWVRAATFHRHVAPHIETMANAWVNDPRVPLVLREPTRDWLALITHGHTPGQDVVVPGVRHVLNALRIPVTNGEVARGMNWMMANMYRGALGGRVDVLMRDSIGPLFAVPRVGLAPVANAYLDFFKSGRKREAMWAIAKAKGWVESGMVPMGASEMFESGFNVGMPGNTPVNEAFAPWQNSVREGMARVGDITRDVLPPGMRSGMQGTLADPLLAYTKLGEFNRLISGWAGWTNMLQATERLAEFRVRMPDANLDNGIAAALMESGAANYPAPIQRRLVELLRSQQYEEAAGVFANEVANSQFRYGTAEGTALSREKGVTGFVVGKLGSTFGTFTNQYIAQMREGLTQGGLIEELGGRSTDKVRSGVKFAAGQYLIGAALAAGATATGWNLAKWFWHGSLGWGGGPMMMTGMTKLLEYSGRWQQEMGENPSPMQLAAIRQGESSYPSPLTLNPYSGTMRTVQGFGAALGSAAPFETALGYTMTGRLTSPDMVRQFTDPAFGIQATADWLRPGTPQLNQYLTALPDSVSAGGLVGQDIGTSPERVYMKNGHPVVDTPNRTRDGKVPTHALDVPSGRQVGESWEQYEARVLATPDSAFPREVRNVDSSLESLVPAARMRILQLVEGAAREGVRIRVGETYRPIQRQEWLFKEGRAPDRGGAPVTWTLTSRHADRKAADLDTSGDGYRWIQENAHRFGLNVLGMYDPGHVFLADEEADGAVGAVASAGLGAMQ